MTVNWRHGISALAALGVLGALSGCGTGIVSVVDQDYDFKALDSYLVDRDDVGLAFAKPVRSETGTAYATGGSDAAGASTPTHKVSTASWSASDFVGEWIGSIDMSDDSESFESTGDPEQDAMMREMGEAMAGALSGMMQMPLSLKSDGTFSMVMVVFPIEGTWSVEGNSITLEPETVMGMTQAEMTRQDPSKSEDWESMDLTVMEDGTLEMVDPDNPSSVMIFARK
ncbi:MAG: hypothetical protein IH944_09940 [Armatimonadetes bacterium]|nr:hypothetical protein [Armatimonadota bacterium]